MTSCPDRPTWTRFDELEGSRRASALEHARGCAACRRLLLVDDPSRAFALLAARPIPPAVLERVSSRVASAIATGDLAASDRTARHVAAAGWAAALLLAAGAAGLLSGPSEVPELSTPAVTRAVMASGEIGLQAGVEVLSSPGNARIVDLAVGDTQVVMIFDEGLDL
jgi:hypothetical protein